MDDSWVIPSVTSLTDDSVCTCNFQEVFMKSSDQYLKKHPVKGRSIETRMILQNWFSPIVHQCVTYGTLLVLVRRDRGTFFCLRIIVSGGIGFIGFEMSNWGIAKGVNLCFATSIHNNIFQLKTVGDIESSCVLPFVQKCLVWKLQVCFC